MKPTQEADVIVVGTGPGGATVAREMTRRKKDVLMLEWGKAAPVRGTMRQFAAAAAVPGKSLLVTGDLCGMVRGITTGGSSMFYYGTAFEPPVAIFDACGIDLRPEIEETRAELPVAPLGDELVGPMATRIMQSARELGYDWQKLPKFIDQEKCRPDCFRCNYGCPEGAKWSGRLSVDAARREGARLVSGARVERVLVENGKAVGVAYRKRGRSRRAYAPVVVVSAGGIGSPLILRQTGLTEAGRDFFFDPLIVVMGTLGGIRGGREIPMAAGMHREADGYVITDMTVPWTLHAVLNAAVGRLDQLHRHRQTLAIMVKIKDGLGGRLTDRGGIRKRLTASDKVKINKGYTQAREILAHAGARNIHRSWYLAAHPGGTAKIGEIVDRDLQTRFDGLYVCDCSVMPDAWGLPPTFTLVALGKRLARHLACK
ncbi:MAG: GMC family oxidoreductase [Desulfobacterales bacterium]|nr:GMC family oxidoreductase [Desulfobacterales bacterium]